MMRQAARSSGFNNNNDYKENNMAHPSQQEMDQGEVTVI
jgi:hypothetical protein